MSINLVGGISGSSGEYIDPTQNMTASEYIDYIENQVDKGKMSVEEAINSLKAKQYPDSVDKMRINSAIVKLELSSTLPSLPSLDESLAEFQNNIQTLSNKDLQKIIDVYKSMKDIEGIDIDNVDQFLEIAKAEQERRKADSPMALFSKS